MDNLFGPEPLCNCPDSIWEFRMYVEGQLVHSAQVDCDQNLRKEEDIEWETRAISIHHVNIAEKAIAESKDWATEVICPSCGHGGRLTPDGPEIIEPNL